jgi:hypothetical protein
MNLGQTRIYFSAGIRYKVHVQDGDTKLMWESRCGCSFNAGLDFDLLPTRKAESYQGYRTTLKHVIILPLSPLSTLHIAWREITFDRGPNQEAGRGGAGQGIDAACHCQVHAHARGVDEGQAIRQVDWTGLDWTGW